MRVRGGDRERGAVLVEAAFVLPILFFIFLGFMELSLVIAGNSAGSNAARDGVRVGVLQYENADINGSPNNLAIKAAVDAKLGKMVKGTPIVTVECIKADSEAVIGCTRAAGDSGVEVDRDLIQVTVTWTQLVVTPLVDSDHTETARATVQGAPDFSPDASPLAVYFDDPDQDGIATPVNVNEPDNTANLTLHRSGDSAPALTVSLGVGAATTAQPADYSFASTVTFASGVDDVTVPVTIVDDDDVEGDEVLIVEITGLTVTPATANAIVGQPQRVAVTIDSEDVDTTPPSPTTARYTEEPLTSRDGRIDFVMVDFSEPVANVGSWSIANGGPAGASLGTPMLGASGAVVIPVNVATVDTDGAFAVSATGVTDAFGNAFSGTINLTDAANPVLTSVTRSGPTPGLASPSDILRFNFSEPVVAGPGNDTLVLTNAGANDTLSIPGFLAASTTTGGNYNNPNGNGGNPATFAVTLQIVGNQVSFTLGACSPPNNCNALNTMTGTPPLGLAFASAVVGADTLPVQLPSAALSALLF